MGSRLAGCGLPDRERRDARNHAPSGDHDRDARLPRWRSRAARAASPWAELLAAGPEGPTRRVQPPGEVAQLLWLDRELDHETVPSGAVVLMRALEQAEASALRWFSRKTALECAEVAVLALCPSPT